MHLYEGKKVIGKLQKSNLVMDWHYMSKNYGMRKEAEQIDQALGRLMQFLGIAGLIIVIAIDINSGLNPLEVIWQLDNFSSILFWGFYLLIIYSFYLLRNRERFSDTLVRVHLDKLRKLLAGENYEDEIIINQYFTDSIYNIYDDLLKTDGHYFLENVLKYLLQKQGVKQALQRLGLEQEQLSKYIETMGMDINTHIDEWINPITLNSFKIALENNFEKIDEQAIFLYLANVPLRDYLLKNDVVEKDLEALQMWIKNVRDSQRFARMYQRKSALKPVSTVNRAYTSRYSPTLIQFSRDYTAEVIREDFIYSIGREDELNKLIEILESGDKSPVLVIGAPGVGKTTFLKSLAVRMVVEDVPEVLKDKRLVGFDFTRAFALSNNIDIFKRRLINMFEEIVAAKNIILVLDDLYQLINIRPEYVSEIVGIIFKVIDKYDIRMVCTSTPEGYSRYIKPQQALVSLFDLMEMAEPSDEIALQILLDELPKIESKYKVKIEFEAIRNVIKLSHKYAFERVLPDKGIDLLEESCTRAINQKLDFVSENIVDQIVSEKVGVNIGDISSGEAESLIQLEQNLQQRVVGQHEAVTAVASAMRRSRAGLSSEKRPIASFLFFGPTGVGKTELSKALAKVYFGDEELMIRVDMSEYQEQENVARLIGKSIDNTFEGGFLTEAVRQKPFSLILLDEIEKANPKVLDLFLQVLDEGHITDGMGRKVEFKNTIIIATSNVASREIADLVSAGKRYQDVLENVMPQLRKYLRVEFINRFDKVVMFRPLSRIDINKITKIMLDKVKTRLMENKGIQLMYGEKLVDQVAKLGYDPIYGARKLNRAIQDNVEDKISLKILAEKLSHGSIIVMESLDKISVRN